MIFATTIPEEGTSSAGTPSTMELNWWEPWLSAAWDVNDRLGSIADIFSGNSHLVGADWNMVFMTFHLVGNVIIPTDS
jgi:hypothetical protein